MKKSTLLLASAAAAFALFGIGSCTYVVSVRNTQAEIENRYEMKIKSNEAEFDNMWKKIQQVAAVPNEKKEAFKEILGAYVNGRGQNGGTVLSAVREAVPNFDLNIYDQLTNIIVGSRNTWTTNQRELVSVAEEYNANLTPLVKGFVLKSIFGFKKIDPKIITSDKTEEAFKTGKDNDVDLFGKKPAPAQPAQPNKPAEAPKQ